MRCAECRRLWELYDHRRKIHVNLRKGAREGTRNLKKALERANDERQESREQIWKHAATHKQPWFSGPLAS